MISLEFKCVYTYVCAVYFKCVYIYNEQVVCLAATSFCCFCCSWAIMVQACGVRISIRRPIACLPTTALWSWMLYLRCTALHYSVMEWWIHLLAVHCTTLQRYSTLHIVQDRTVQCTTALKWLAPRYTTLHCLPLQHYTTLHSSHYSTTLHYIAFHYSTTLHCITRYNIL